MAYLQSISSTCFGHHYAHLQEPPEHILLHMVFQHLILLAGVLGSRDAGRVHCVEAAT